MSSLTKELTKLSLLILLAMVLSVPGVTGCSNESDSLSVSDSDRATGAHIKFNRDQRSIRLPNDVPLTMVWIDPGDFVMGSRLRPERLTEMFGDVAGDPKANAVDAVRRHVVISKGFWLGKYEVTNRQFEAFVESTGYITEGERIGGGLVVIDGRWQYVEGVTWRDHNHSPHPDVPVVMVTWEDANRFAAWLSGISGLHCRLPTEAEWEYAARAGTDTEFVFGDEPTEIRDYDWCGREASGVDHAQIVGQKRPNDWGLYDTVGNVFEWVHDWYGPFDTHPTIDPKGPDEGRIKVVRGGSWFTDIGSCRSNHRAADRASLSEAHFGFRMLCHPVGRD